MDGLKLGTGKEPVFAQASLSGEGLERKHTSKSQVRYVLVI
jgi:hypothetical protein